MKSKKPHMLINHNCKPSCSPDPTTNSEFFILKYFEKSDFMTKTTGKTNKNI